VRSAWEVIVEQYLMKLTPDQQLTLLTRLQQQIEDEVFRLRLRAYLDDHEYMKQRS
jgi:hypothetical protein